MGGGALSTAAGAGGSDSSGTSTTWGEVFPVKGLVTGIAGAGGTDGAESWKAFPRSSALLKPSEEEVGGMNAGLGSGAAGAMNGFATGGGT